MKGSFVSTGTFVSVRQRKWYKNVNVWIVTSIVVLLLMVIVFTGVLMYRRSERNQATHIHYTRISTSIYSGNYELYRLNVLAKRNPTQQYKLLADFIRASIFNRSNYEKLLPNCPIIYSMSTADHPEQWRAMIFGTLKYPRNTMPYPYVCFLGVLPSDRRNKLGSILLNQFLNDMSQVKQPRVTHVQLHANWENCRAQRLYSRCGFRCNEFTLDGYSKPFEPEYKFGHMVRMELNMANIRNLTAVCRDARAVYISTADEQQYAQLCNKNKPGNLNGTCDQQLSYGNRSTTMATTVGFSK